MTERGTAIDTKSYTIELEMYMEAQQNMQRQRDRASKDPEYTNGILDDVLQILESNRPGKMHAQSTNTRRPASRQRNNDDITEDLFPSSQKK